MESNPIPNQIDDNSLFGSEGESPNKLDVNINVSAVLTKTGNDDSPIKQDPKINISTTSTKSPDANSAAKQDVKINTSADSAIKQDDKINISTTSTKTAVSGDIAMKSQVKQFAYSSSPIAITVANPKMVSDKSMIGYMVYPIKGNDKDGSYESFRRYSEFVAIRECMIARWPGCLIPALPPKKTMGNKEAKFLEERRRFLDRFCKLISGLNFLYYSEEFQIFIRSKHSDIEKPLSNLAKCTTEDIIARYRLSFPHLVGKEVGNDTVIKIISFNAYLKKTQAIFKNFKTATKAMAKAKKEYYDQFNSLHNSCLIEYEKHCLAEYCDHNEEYYIFNQPNNVKLSESLQKIKEEVQKGSFESMYNYMRSESYEIDAFLEALSIREKYDGMRTKAQEKQRSLASDLQKIIGGKTTMKTLLSRKTKEEEKLMLEKQIMEVTAEIENLKVLYELMTLQIANFDIPKFKREKIEKYHKVVKSCSGNELVNNQNLIAYWNIINENSSKAKKYSNLHNFFFKYQSITS